MKKRMRRVRHGFENTPMRLHTKKVMQIWNGIPNLHNFLCVYTPIALYVLAVVKQFFVKRVLAKRLCRTEYDEFVAGTGYGHIHASEV